MAMARLRLPLCFLSLLVSVLAITGPATQAVAGLLAPGTPHAAHNHDKDDRFGSANYALGPTAPGKWGPGSYGAGATVTWSLMPSGGIYSALDTFLPAGFKAEIEKAFDAWSAAANITFVEVPDDGAPFDASPTAGHGDIRIAGHAIDGSSGTLAHAYYPPANGNTAAGDIHLDSDENWAINSLDGNYATKDIFQIVAHEIGHSIGLAHSLVPSSLMNAYYSESVSGPQADEIAGAKSIYGPPLPVSNPEPSSLALLGVGVVGLLGYGRRRKRSKAA